MSPLVAAALALHGLRVSRHAARVDGWSGSRAMETLVAGLGLREPFRTGGQQPCYPMRQPTTWRHPVAIAVHIINKPKSDAAQLYETGWRRMEEQGLDRPTGRQSHTAWLVGEVLHVFDVWDSQDDMNAFMTKIGPILHEFDMELDGQPEVGDVLRIARAD